MLILKFQSLWRPFLIPIRLLAKIFFLSMPSMRKSSDFFAKSTPYCFLVIHNACVIFAGPFVKFAILSIPLIFLNQLMLVETTLPLDQLLIVEKVILCNQCSWEMGVPHSEQLLL